MKRQIVFFNVYASGGGAVLIGFDTAAERDAVNTSDIVGRFHQSFPLIEHVTGDNLAVRAPNAEQEEA
jgi:hypothetical protein